MSLAGNNAEESGGYMQFSSQHESASLKAVGSFVVVDCAFCTCAGWCKKNLQKLLAAMKANILDDKKELSYTHGERTLDWEKVAFPPFSPEECKQKWKEVIQKVGQILTLT